MKKIISTILCLVLLLGLALTVHAAEYPAVFDEAGIMSASDVRILGETVQEISQKHGIDIVILTVPSLEGKTAQAYADDYFDYNGYGPDGVIFLLAMAEREYYISTCGTMIDILDDETIYYMEDSFVPYLSDGEYYEAFYDFVTYLDIHMTDDPIGDAITCIILAIIPGLVVAGIGLLFLRFGMNTKEKQYAAREYMTSGSYNMTKRDDIFLYSRVTKQRKPEPSESSGSSGGGTHTSSSGRSHGGHGGKF